MTVNKRLFLPLLLLATTTSAIFAETQIFNGRDLDGWSGDPRLWSVENGAIVGRTNDSDRAVKSNTFLIYDKEVPGDFQLSYKARVSASNSGVQYRSRVIDKKAWRLGGYQMDLHPKPAFLGMMYEEKGRGILCKHGEQVVVPEGGKPKVTGKLESSPAKLSDWNDYRIVARGNILRHYVNGKLAMELRDEDPDKRRIEGALGLQLHVGPPMVAEFKDIVLSDLSETVDTAGASTNKTGQSKSDEIQWIWGSPNPKASEKVFFRREFVLPPGITGATLEVVGDDAQRTWVNGHDLGMQMDWSRLVRHDVAKHLKPGRNVLAIEGRNATGNAGIALRMRIELDDGTSADLVTDKAWMISSESSEGWLQPGLEMTAWQPAAVLAKMGAAPWGNIIGADAVAKKAAPEGPSKDMTDSFKVLPGFKLEQIRKIPASEGSWVAMTVDPEGHLICGDQYGKIYRLDVKTGKAEPLPIPLDGIHGLLWFGDSLYVTVTESKKVDRGVYRVQSGANGTFRRPQLLKKMAGRGEHGPHSLIASPDGKWIYFCAGNSTKLAKMDASLVPRVWDEDQLLPRRPDARGHAATKMAPGGWIARFKPDGSDWQLVGMGLRNEYDIAFNAEGDLFTYDADMEWDLGMPWYRPTRINHVIPGADMGWRNGTGKWPSYSEDSMPEVVNIGPGSPTGLLSGKGAAFPARYQMALFALDWTFATIHVVHLRKQGATYSAETEELVAGKGLPLTDAQIGKDGHMYFLTGGRKTDSAVWRVRYVGDEPVSPVEFSDQLAPTLDRDQALAALSSSDRTLRQQGRLYFEIHPSETPGTLGKLRDKPWETIQAAIIQARLNDGKKAKEMLRYLTALDFESLELQQQLAWLRATGLAFIRGGGADGDERASVLNTIDASYPARNEDLNAELVRMLAYLNAPGVVGRTLTLMDTAPPPVAPDWMAIAGRNSRYGSTVKSMLRSLPPARVIHYVYALRAVPGPWDRSERERFFGWLKKLDSKSGGKSYDGFLKDLTKETLKRATPQERRWLKDFVPSKATDPLANLPTAKGPGRNWTVEGVEALAKEGFEDADLANGKKMFKAALCAACHSYGGQGGAAGPDLSSLGGRFTVKSLAVALIDPSQEVSDQYAFDILTKEDGAQIVGRIKEEKDDRWIVAVNPFDFSQTVEVERGDVVNTESSPISPMPGGLINQLNENELRNLLAYLLGK